MSRKKKEPQKASDSNTVRYTHEGYQYIGTSTSDLDEYKVEHRIVESSTGKVVFPDFTPYCFMSKVDFQNYVSLGYPGRIVPYRPLSSDDIRKLNKKGSRTAE